MQNWILFQTIWNLDGQFVSEQEKKLKNKKNLIRADEFSFDRMKIFRRKNFEFDEKAIHLRTLDFPYFSVSCAVVAQVLGLNLWQFEREFNSSSAACFLLLWRWIFDDKDFDFVKAEFTCTN